MERVHGHRDSDPARYRSADPAQARPTVGPEHHGLAMDFDEFTEADFEEGWLYELARGIVIVTKKCLAFRTW